MIQAAPALDHAGNEVVQCCENCEHLYDDSDGPEYGPPWPRFGGLTGQLTENREAVCEYVNELLAIRAARKDGKS